MNEKVIRRDELKVKHGDIKGYVCLFKMEGHYTYRIMSAPKITTIEKQLKNQIGPNKIIAKKFFEIDRVTGSFEEF